MKVILNRSWALSNWITIDMMLNYLKNKFPSAHIEYVIDQEIVEYYQTLSDSQIEISRNDSFTMAKYLVDSEEYEIEDFNTVLRYDTIFIEMIEKLIENDKLYEEDRAKVITIPDGIEFDIYSINEPWESIHEKHKIWS